MIRSSHPSSRRNIPTRWSAPVGALPLERFVSLKHFSSAMSSRHAGPGPQRSGVVTTDAHHPSRPEWRHTCPSTPRTRTPSKNRFFVVGQNSSALGWDRVVVGFRIIPGCPLSGAGVPLSGVLVWLLNGCPPQGFGAPCRGFRVPAGDGVWSGGFLLSHTLPRAVPSALEGLTSGFGMGPGVSLPPWPPARSLTPDGGAPWPGFPVRVSRTTQWTRAPAVTGPPPLRGAGCVGQASRPFGIGQLHASRRFHVRPINPVVCRGPYQHGAGESSS